MSLPKELLEVLACPFCKSDIKLTDNKLICCNQDCNLKYPIIDDIPVMLIDEAEKPCPSCGKERELKGEDIVCPSCSKSISFKKITTK